MLARHIYLLLMMIHDPDDVRHIIINHKLKCDFTYRRLVNSKPIGKFV